MHVHLPIFDLSTQVCVCVCVSVCVHLSRW